MSDADDLRAELAEMHAKDQRWADEVNLERDISRELIGQRDEARVQVAEAWDEGYAACARFWRGAGPNTGNPYREAEL